MKSAVFVIGSTRSGTSALRSALYQTRFKGPGEAHTTGLLGHLVREGETYLRTSPLAKGENLLRELTPDDLGKALTRSYFDLISDIYGAEYFIDKTPTRDPIDALPLVDQATDVEVFYVFCRRRGIDNLQSKFKKFVGVEFEQACIEWSTVLDLWDSRKADLRRPFIEIDFFDLVFDRASVARRVRALLGLSADEETAMVAYLETSGEGLTHAAPIGQSLSATEWSDEEKALFLRICMPAMTRSGYGIDSYWAG